PGVAGNVSNSQCTLSSGGSSVSSSGNTLTVNIVLTFQPAFAGAKNIYLFALDTAGLKTAGWQNVGTWNTGGNGYYVTPSSGAGASLTFALRYLDANGVTDLSQLF